MARSESLLDARRALELCNACRYCEAFCAVFPALELKRTLADGDPEYLAHLCHDCRDCYYACPFIPPHPFELNLPATLARVRHETYGTFARPRALGFLLHHTRLAGALVTAIAAVTPWLLYLLLDATAEIQPTDAPGGAFYRVVPYGVMVLPAIALVAIAFGALFASAVQFWRTIRPASRSRSLSSASRAAIADALSLRFQKGGGAGCNYPDHRFAHLRRWCHHGILYGFALCLVASVCAAAYEHLLGEAPPYPYVSAPVLLGSLGGMLMVAGTAGATLLKLRSDPAPSASVDPDMDFVLLGQLFLTSSSGLALLVARASHLMPILLLIHLGLVLALFLSLASGKFVHWIYRLLALARFRLQEETVEEHAH